MCSTTLLVTRQAGCLLPLSLCLIHKQLHYLLDRRDLTYHELANMLDPVEDPPDAPRTREFPGETFRVLKEKEIRQYGEYRTKRLLLAARDALQRSEPATAVTW
jgi:hypothetical protein